MVEANPFGVLQFPIKKTKKNPKTNKQKIQTNPLEYSRKTNVFIQHLAPGKYYSPMTIQRVIC
jgi:hypothetical protein